MSDLQNATHDLAGIDAMTVSELAVLPAATFVSLRAEVNRIAEEAYRLEGKLTAALDYRYGPRAHQARAAQDKDTGTVRFEDNPADYVKVKLEVSERAYEAWPAKLRELFTPARTVETGRPSYDLIPPDQGRRT